MNTNLFQNYNWRISRKDGRMFVENLVTGFCDWPIRYDNGHVVYDYPERLPKYIKAKIKQIFNKQ